jgi:hypothetical protein
MSHWVRKSLFSALIVGCVLAIPGSPTLAGGFNPPPVDECDDDGCGPPPPPVILPTDPPPEDDNENDRRLSALFECCWRVVKGRSYAGSHCSRKSLDAAIRNGEIMTYTAPSGSPACTYGGAVIGGRGVFFGGAPTGQSLAPAARPQAPAGATGEGFLGFLFGGPGRIGAAR